MRKKIGYEVCNRDGKIIFTKVGIFFKHPNKSTAWVAYENFKKLIPFVIHFQNLKQLCHSTKETTFFVWTLIPLERQLMCYLSFLFFSPNIFPENWFQTCCNTNISQGTIERSKLKVDKSVKYKAVKNDTYNVKRTYKFKNKNCKQEHVFWNFSAESFQVFERTMVLVQNTTVWSREKIENFLTVENEKRWHTQ